VKVLTGCAAMKSLGSSMVEATVEIYQTIAAELLPIPAKSHYTFNMRDLAKVFQGISLASPERMRLSWFLCFSFSGLDGP
jgi:dynein heavy chain